MNRLNHDRQPSALRTLKVLLGGILMLGLAVALFTVGAVVALSALAVFALFSLGFWIALRLGWRPKIVRVMQAQQAQAQRTARRAEGAGTVIEGEYSEVKR